MQFGYSDVCLEHDTGERHPETADRLRAIQRALQHKHHVDYQDGPAATREQIQAVHRGTYLNELKRFCENDGGSWDRDTVASEGTWDAARKSAGLALWAARQALDGADGRQTPFSLGRPPGHHAVSHKAMGFCFVNNAAVAAQTLLDEGEVDRVAIFDWDVHHGNGTQDIFYDREDVFYGSIHEEGIYPGSGNVDETGTGDGERATLNAPLPAGAGDADFLHVVDEALAPALADFDPDLVIVSAGFDAHEHDPISRHRVSTEGYALLTDRLRSIADANDAALAFVLEGGYGLDTLSEGVGMVHETFDGREPITCEDDPETSTVEITDDIRRRLDIE
ncbi:histone deacetylase family protein [Halonotius pteroides]|uniref:Histone deacetylase n=1 Tax=Halonotius pteroides TaxID=268735 RepID=A0A3A6QM60_9EURY|nr:histone deacetylase [Halonotius pteroides]RJX48756.1 histone deacetylase [Halonotius pteroides]